jgi:uncharacterized membrane protein YqiK
MLVTGFALARMYRRATPEIALVKTGKGGRKIITSGGTIVIPVLHEITPIKMSTTRLELKREGKSALITKDSMRVDVGVEFYITVTDDDQGIGKAAQTLGDRTFDEKALRELIEGKLVDGLRAVAAQMDIDELHQNRSQFVQEVQRAVSGDLTKNGLSLESVSLTSFDQTPFEGLDENNVFNAQGMKIQAQRIAESRMRRAEIEADANVAVAKSIQQGEVQRYAVEQEQEQARVSQRVAMDELAAREAGEKARFKEESDKAAEVARITREQAIEIAEQDRKIAVSEKSELESEARAKADSAKAAAIVATESIETARQVAEGERKKRLTILSAEEEAEKSATTTRVLARADREAAEDRATAMLAIANAEASEITIRAEADRLAKLAEAEGTLALISADNSISNQIIDFRLSKARLEALPAIVREMVKPAEKIGQITIHKVDGLGVGGNGGSGAGADAGGNSGGLVNQAFDEIRNMAFQLPALQAIGKQVGVNMDAGFNGLLEKEFSGVVAPSVNAGDTMTVAAE